MTAMGQQQTLMIPRKPPIERLLSVAKQPVGNAEYSLSVPAKEQVREMQGNPVEVDRPPRRLRPSCCAHASIIMRGS